MQSGRSCGITLGLGVLLAGSLPRLGAAAEPPFLPRAVNSSTIPANGDLNPYGVAFVPAGFSAGGALAAGDVLVTNFNDAMNVQGTGTTIIRLDPSGALAPPGEAVTFFTSTLPGLSTAIGVLRAGFVLVGNVSTTDGTFATIGAGALQVLDRQGKVLQTWRDATFLDGPWDLTLADHGSTAEVYVANVLNGTVTRLDLTLSSIGVTLAHKTTIASGYSHVPNAAAVVLGPTGLAFDARTDTLYVASTADNAIYAVESASHRATAANKGSRVFADAHLRGPLALRFAPNGHLLTANGDAVNADPLHPSEIVEFTRAGHFVREYDVDSSQGGAFGIDTVLDAPDGWDANSGRYDFAVVDDVTNTLSVVYLRERD